MLTTKVVFGLSQLPPEVDRDSLSDNGPGAGFASYLLVYHDNRLIAVRSDAMEPEDATFGRDLKWVGPLVELAYQLGRQDERS